MTNVFALSSYVTLLSLCSYVTARPTWDIETRAPGKALDKRAFLFIDGDNPGLSVGLTVGLSLAGLLLVYWLRVSIYNRRRAKLQAMEESIVASQGAYPHPGTESQMGGALAPEYNLNNTVPPTTQTTSATPTHDIQADKGLTQTQIHMVDIPLNGHAQSQTQYPQPQMYQQNPMQTQQEFVSGHINTVQEVPETHNIHSIASPPLAASRH